MSKEKRRVPKLRFPGFAEDWEQRKFSDLYEKISEKNDLSYSLDKIISVANMYYKSDAKVSNEEYLKTYNIFRYGEIAFEGNKSKDFAYGRFVENTIGDGIISHVFEVFRPIAKYDIYFWKYYINYEAIMGKILSRCTKKTTMMTNLVAKDFLKETVLVPTLAEQKQIGTLLNAIDKFITLHQRKLNNLKLKKKALLQKLFPKNGERYPELRFPGFTDAWEQRKLSELATMNARIGWQNLRTSEFLDNGDYLLITGTDFDNGRIKYSTCHYVEKKRFDQDTKIQLSTGSILITKDGTLGKVALVEELPKPATLNAGVFNVRVKDDAFLSYKYLYHYLKAPFLMKYVTANATGGTIKHLNQSILVDFPIPITEKQEQDRIAKLLDSLESIITLHQRKLDHLQLQKKALLQQMFV